jgi:hypothetical protein
MQKLSSALSARMIVAEGELTSGRPEWSTI